ncbi:MAG: BrnT family toxin [Mariprofundus sp.]
MAYEWDEGKRTINLEKHGIDFSAIHLFDWESATIFADQRIDYNEPRMVAYGRIKGRLIVVVYAMRGDKSIRVISMRKANKREVVKYG